MDKAGRVIVGWAVLLGAGVLPAAGQDQYEWQDGRWVKVAAPAKGTAGGELELIRRDVERGWYRTAGRSAKAFLKKYPIEPEAEEVLSLAGRAELGRGRYFQAYERFERQLVEFPNGQYFERSLEQEYGIAEAFLSGKKRIVLGFIYVPAQDDALSILTRIVEHAPGSALAEKSLLRIADYHFQQAEYTEAVKAYEQYLDVFGGSEKAPYAMLQAARASQGAFRGPQYDETPLLEARQRYQMFAQRFPVQAERADVPKILEDIRQSLAEKNFVTAQFYERVARKGPAAFYYRVVVQEYPQTAWEARARAALARLGEPAERQPQALSAPATSRGVE